MSDLQKEREIPVFTVLKNNAILKNIFLINSPPNFNANNQENDFNLNKTHQEFEETLLVGRHPDCDIRLEHPSISRFHLRIHSLPSSKLLFLTDLSSVHGTWVSGKRIEPEIRTMVKEGDDLRIGVSSRVYKLNWIPLSQAYDVSQPFVPPLDFSDPQEDEDEMIKDEISGGLIEAEVNYADNISDDIFKGLESLDLCDDDEMFAEEVVPLSIPLQPQKSGSMKNEDTEDVEVDFGGIESRCLDDITLEHEQKEMLLPPPICGDDEMFAEEVVSLSLPLQPQKSGSMKNEDTEDVGVGFGGIECRCLDDITLEHEQKEMLLPPSICDEDLEYGDAQSVDSILECLVPLFMGENWEWVQQEDNYLRCPSEDDYPQSSKDEDTGFISSVLEGLNTLLLDENSELLGQNDTPSAPTMPEDIKFPTAEILSNTTAEGGPELGSENLGIGKQSLLQEEDLQDSAWSFWYGPLVAPSSTADVGCLLNTECNHLGLDNENLQHESEPIELSETNLEGDLAKKHQEGNLWSFWSGKMGVESVCSALSDSEFFSEAENISLTNGYLSSPLSSHKRQTGSPLITSEQKSVCSFWSRTEKLDSICSSLSAVESFLESENKFCGDCYQSPKSLSSVKRRFGSPLITSDQNPVDSIWLRRGKSASAPQVLTNKTEEKKVKTGQKSAKHEPISRALFHEMNNQQVDQPEEEQEELFTPDKENFTPTTHKSMRKLAMLKEIEKSSSAKSPLLKMIYSPNKHHEDIISPFSDKENYSPRIQQKQKTARRASANQVQSVRLKQRKGGRMPFQSLLADSPQKTTSECYIPDADAKSGTSVDSTNNECKGKSVREGLPQWNMVVDTTTLLNKESRKTLQLLEGLKGTQLIIPRIVIAELASLRRQLSFFRRNPEVLSALEWIQDCMLKTPWWIHVQNTVEEGRPVAPTPPASPHSPLSCGTSSSYLFSSLESRMELLSPTVEDDVLDYALIFRKFQNDGQLVLLSNDITMKIKSMAEGIICETPEEFRESLVNPFSERFRWTDSSPRGQTWSCADDIVLKERFYPSSLKMTPKAMENVKGLKLILLHNSRYYERMTATY